MFRSAVRGAVSVLAAAVTFTKPPPTLPDAGDTVSHVAAASLVIVQSMFDVRSNDRVSPADTNVNEAVDALNSATGSLSFLQDTIAADNINAAKTVFTDLFMIINYLFIDLFIRDLHRDLHRDKSLWWDMHRDKSLWWDMHRDKSLCWDMPSFQDCALSAIIRVIRVICVLILFLVFYC